MKTILYFILFFTCIYSALSIKPSSIGIPVLDGSEQYIHFPFQSLARKDRIKTKSSCHHCFNVYTLSRGLRLIVEPCGDNCVPIITNTHLKEHHYPTQNYDFDKCGLTNEVPSLKTGKIKLKISTNVKNTLRPAEYPWLVRIESRMTDNSNTVILCGGTLIHPQWILTAAHCMFDTKTTRLYPANGVNLYMGHYDRSKSSKMTYMKHPALYIIHPKFRISRTSPAPIHDLALIKLAKPVPLSRSINVACLPEETDELNNGTLAYTAGWGYTSLSATVADKPRKARIRISPGSCKGLMADKNLHICGRNERGNNICSGDSGTGLLVRAGIPLNNTETVWKWHLFGIASYGLEECSEHVNHDNVFASVPVDVEWIREMMKTY